MVLTRTNDAEVSLAERIAVADRAAGDFFLSLHFNSGLPNRELAGIETYCVTPAGMPSNATVYSHIEDMTGWASCTSSCSGGNGTAIFSLTQQQASPSLDGSSTLFSYDGGPAFSHILWSQHLSSNGTASNFVLDMGYYIDRPANAQGLEFAANQQLPNQWYKFSTQCSFADGKWRVWDSANQGWVATSAPCTQPPANTWQHLTFEYQRANGQAVFVAITVNGQRYSINQSFNPQAHSGSTSVGVHFEIDGDSTAQPYNVWIDEMTLNIW